MRKTESSYASKGQLPLGTARRDLLRCGNGIGEDDLGQAILVAGIGVGDVSLGFLEFGLAEFDGKSGRAVAELLTPSSVTGAVVRDAAEMDS